MILRTMNKICNFLKKTLAFLCDVVYSIFCWRAERRHKNGLLVKRLRRRPLTAKTGVRFPYELLISFLLEVW